MSKDKNEGVGRSPVSVGPPIEGQIEDLEKLKSDVEKLMEDRDGLKEQGEYLMKLSADLVVLEEKPDEFAVPIKGELIEEKSTVSDGAAIFGAISAFAEATEDAIVHGRSPQRNEALSQSVQSLKELRP